MQTDSLPSSRDWPRTATQDNAWADLEEFSETAAANNVLFYHSGYFSQTVIDAGVASIRARLDDTRTEARCRRRLLSSFIEIAQNVVHYSAETATAPLADNNESRFGTVCIAARGDRFHINCANPVRAASHERLANKLAMLREMGMDDIRHAYREILRSTQGEEGSKGAGLGLLTMARDACEPIEFEFAEDSERGDDFRIFRLKVTI